MSETKSNSRANVEIFILLGLVVLCLAIFGQAVGFQFINFDDNFYVYENPFVLGGLSSASIKWAFTAFHSANWHPLTWLSHMLDVTLFGRNPGAHHATNVILHTLNSFLAFLVFRGLTGSLWKSAAVAVLFAVHPAHVESVAWVSERKDVLSTLFWLLTMLAYSKYAKLKTDADDENNERRTTNNQQIYYFLTIFLFALGLMSKPMLVTLPFVLLLCDFWPLERLKTFKDLPGLIVEKLPLFILSIVSAYITLIAQKSGGAVQTLEMLAVETRLANALVSYAKYVLMLFYPFNLGAAYPYRESIPAWQTFGALAFLVAVTAHTVRQIKKRKYLLTGWLWFLGTLVPVIGLVQVGAQSMADRYTYVPYFGLFIMVVWSAAELFERLKLDKKIVAAIALLVTLALGFLCFQQTSRWRNAETLYTHTLAAGQGNFIIKLNLCNHLMRENRLDEAERHCLASIEENPNYVDSYNTLGVISVRQQKLEAAVANFKKSLELNPNDAVVYTNLAAPLAMLGKPEEAERHIDRAAEIYKKAGTNVSVLNNAYSSLAAAYAGQKKYDRSSEILSRLVRTSPEKPDLRANYALSLYFQNRLDEAGQEIEQAVRQNPNHAESYNLYGMILIKQNRRNEAIEQFEKALRLKPDLTEAKENLRQTKGEAETK